MDHETADFDPNKLAAVLYRPEDDIDSLLHDFAATLRADGVAVGGVVQRNAKTDEGRIVQMHLLDLTSGREIRLCQDLGSGATSCRLDPAGLAEASRAVGRAIEAGSELVVVNKFSKQEAAGKGLRDELAAAIVAGLPVLTAVPEKHLEAWATFTGDRGTMLLCSRRTLDGWWADIAARGKRRRHAAGGRPVWNEATSQP
ncbi:MAG: DUF2478 domain-containing protein [Alphaproteobacteria bacterium]|nr:DUF2478 domain-containing protein [Alphaproteobacteria bacterium]